MKELDRIIKFRTWDKYSKTMFHIKNNIGVKSNGNLIFPFYTKDGCLKNSELMQYIGLQDTNGVDIYEGDIVRVKARLDSAEGVVCFHDSSYCFKVPVCNRFETPYRSIGTGWYGIEIIGNIFETVIQGDL